MGIINMNGRIYDPLIGRFMSADPYIQAPSDLQSFNRYAYARNNPLNLTDPSGYSWWTKFRDKVLKPAIALFIDPYCGGCATLALKAYNGYHTKDVNGNKLGWKGAFFYAGLSLIPGSDNMLVNYGVNVLVGCGSSMMAGGSCKKGMLDAVTVQELGPILGGCLNARRAGGSCAVGAREGLTDYVSGQVVSNGLGYLNNSGNSGGNNSSSGNGDEDNGNGGGDSDGAIGNKNRTVLAVQAGTVETVGWQDINNHNKGFGYRVRIKTDDDMTWIYAHMEPPTLVSRGQKIEIDQIIGNYADPTNGNSTGPHLHLELRDSDNNPITNHGSVRPVPGGRITSRPSRNRTITTVNGSQSRPHNGFDWR